MLYYRRPKMNSFSNDITEQWIDKVYEDLQKEQFRLMNDIKTGKDMEDSKSSTITKQVSCINTINMSLLRLRNMKKKQRDL